VSDMKRLVSQARLQWRHVFRAPQVLDRRRAALVKLRTPAQLKAAAKAHHESKALEASNAHKGHGRSAELRRSAASFGPSETLAYVSRRLLPAHTIVRRVLGEASHLRPNVEPKRMLDVGSGPGTAIWAAGQVESLLHALPILNVSNPFSFTSNPLSPV